MIVSGDDVKAFVMRVNFKKCLCLQPGYVKAAARVRPPTLTALSALPPSSGTGPAVRQPPLFLCLASLLCEGLGLLLLLLASLACIRNLRARGH